MWQGPHAATLPEGTLNSPSFANGGIPVRAHTYITPWLLAGWALPLWVQLRVSLPGAHRQLRLCSFSTPAGEVEPAVRPELCDLGEAFKPSLLAQPVRGTGLPQPICICWGAASGPVGSEHVWMVSTKQPPPPEDQALSRCSALIRWQSKASQMQESCPHSSVFPSTPGPVSPFS